MDLTNKSLENTIIKPFKQRGGKRIFKNSGEETEDSERLKKKNQKNKKGKAVCLNWVKTHTEILFPKNQIHYFILSQQL